MTQKPIPSDKAQTQPVRTAFPPHRQSACQNGEIPTVRISRQAIYAQYATPPAGTRKPGKSAFNSAIGCLALVIGVFLAVLLVYFLAPFPTRLVLMGIDSREDQANLGRTDTIILTQINPLRPRISMLSIPRDLWVEIPGVGENRINTAHFFAEASAAGSGPQALINTIDYNFGIRPRYYIRLRFDGLSAIVDAMGGVPITLENPMGGLAAGEHLLNGDQALAFSRERYSSDDFSRMRQGQILLKAIAQRMLEPEVWSRLPQIMTSSSEFIDTDIPVWLWPRLGLAMARGGISGIDNRTISREMTTPFVTTGGAQVLAPNWELIRPVLTEMFGN